jgi:hypothetical protein
MCPYEYEDYIRIVEDADELYSYDEEHFGQEPPWENYYHNIADELVEE